MNLFQMIFVPLCTAAGLASLVRTARRQTSFRLGLFWAIVWLGTAAIIAVPQMTVAIAPWFGIGRGADLMIYVAAVAGLGASLYFYGRLRHLEMLVTELVRQNVLSHPRRGPVLGSAEVSTGENPKCPGDMP